MVKITKPSLPDAPSLSDSPENCRRCSLWRRATRAVQGEGSAHARIMLIGEQPGNEEDLAGHPFVGPAGRVLDEAITLAGLERKNVFITNAVKHFKWEPRGRRRLHKKPNAGEIDACQVWLEREIAAVKPRVVVALGATALRSITGRAISIDSARRQELSHTSGARILATYHPSAILRAEGEKIERLRTQLTDDLRLAAHISSGEHA